MTRAVRLGSLAERMLKREFAGISGQTYLSRSGAERCTQADLAAVTALLRAVVITEMADSPANRLIATISTVPPMSAPGLLRPVLLVTAFLVLVEAGIGMVVNLYVPLPPSHPGTQLKQTFLSRAAAGLSWAIGRQGSFSLAIHVALSLALVPVSIAAAVLAVLARRRAAVFWAVLGTAFVIASAVNGGSFMDDGGHEVNSLLMALLSFAAVACYLLGVYALPSPRRAVP